MRGVRSTCCARRRRREQACRRESAPPLGKEPRLGPMSASFAGLMSTRVCRANASGHGVETMQLETQLTRPRSDMPAGEDPDPRPPTRATPPVAVRTPKVPDLR